MIINKLRLINFRNIKEAELSFDSAFKFFILHGNNGAGKTSVLEAISLISSSRGLQKASLKEMIKNQEPQLGINALVNAETSIKITYNSKKKSLFINDEKLQKLSQLNSLGSICWLTPSMDRLFFDSKKPRRDFFDRLVYGIDSSFASNLNSYNYMIQSRLRLLQSGNTDSFWLDELEKNIANLGVAIMKSRDKYLHLLNQELTKSDLAIEYNGSAEKLLETYNDKVDLYKQTFKDNRPKDLKTGTTSFGIHKSDVRGVILKSDLTLASSSMGQHKKALIEIIIAHIKVIKNLSDKSPCLLLDEFTSHLDESNKEKLFVNLEKLDVQTIITSVDKKDFDFIKTQSKFIKIDDGIPYY